MGVVETTAGGCGVGLVGPSASALGRLVGVLGVLQCIALALAMSWLIIESTGGRRVAGTTRRGCGQRRAARGCGGVRTGVTIDFLGLEHSFDLDLVKVSEQGKGHGEMRVFCS